MKRLLLSMAIICAMSSCQKTVMENEQGNLPMGNPPMNELVSTNAPANLPPGCGSSTSFTLLADQNIPVGTVTAWNDGENMYISYDMNSDYKLKNIHLYAGSEEGLPLNSSGNPRITQYPYKASFTANTTNYYLVTIPLGSFGFLSAACISSRAVVERFNSCGNRIFNEVAWSNSVRINPGGAWSTKWSHSFQECGFSD